MRIGLLQFAPRWGAPKFNRQKIGDRLAQHTADLWVMPELAVTGYVFCSVEEVSELAEPVPDGATCQFLAHLSHQSQSTLICGLIEKDGGRFFNSAVAYSSGRFIGRYRKIHLFSDEKFWFAPGDEPPPVLNIGSARIGILICFDWLFPEMARSLALRGAQIIAHPANLILPYCQDAMLVRSLENRLYTATANRIGSEVRPGKAPLTFTGKSQVTAPNGQRIGQLSTDREEVLVLDIDPASADDKQFTPRNDIFQDRRPELYPLEKIS